VEQAHAIRSLIEACPPLDVNSTYAYLLLCHHFRRTCVAAHCEDALAGFVSAYVPPAEPNTVFVWQVAVHPDHRGQRLGRAMLCELLARPNLRHVRHLHATVSRSNFASTRMFHALAAELGASCSDGVLFTQQHFGGEAHEAEMLLRIGPFTRLLPCKPTRKENA
jgi:L-2,4-diaminobutyric acid acetyltransferase